MNVTSRIPEPPAIQWPPLRTELARKLREAMRPKTDKVFLNIDYASLEMRILANYTRTGQR